MGGADALGNSQHLSQVKKKFPLRTDQEILHFASLRSE
jgi:hypothetical protein